MVGVMTRKDLQGFLSAQPGDGYDYKLSDLAKPNPVVAYANEPLRVVVYRMAETGLTRFPVVERADPCKIAGMVSLNDFLRARSRNLEEERHRERVLTVRFFGPAEAREKQEVK